MRYIHELADWPRFKWDAGSLSGALNAVRLARSRLTKRMASIGFPLQQDAVLETLTEEIVHSSAIEGEVLDAAAVRSSVARRLGMDAAPPHKADRHVEGISEMMLDATASYDQPLTAERLFAWHAALFPTGRSGMRRIRVGAWRTDESGPMQVVSGFLGQERVHYQAPEAALLERETWAFLGWFNEPRNDHDPLIKAGLAHLWFVTIHPFDDGNGRIARAIAELALARSDNSAQRFYSMSAQIQAERSTYYDILESTQKGSMNVTAWLEWFVACLGRAIDRAETTLSGVLARGQFWDSIRGISLNERQRMMLGRLLEGFKGNLTVSKWSKLAKCSINTALRDINDLVEKGVLVRSAAGGRSTSYSFARRPELPRAAGL